jgi:RHS repeat-associated protein
VADEKSAIVSAPVPLAWRGLVLREVLAEVDGAGGRVLPGTGLLGKGKACGGAGRYYYNARYYDPDLGRFIQADSVLDGANRYAYCHNNPVRYTDPTGERTGDKEDDVTVNTIAGELHDGSTIEVQEAPGNPESNGGNSPASGTTTNASATVVQTVAVVTTVVAATMPPAAPVVVAAAFVYSAICDESFRRRKYIKVASEN